MKNSKIKNVGLSDDTMNSLDEEMQVFLTKRKASQETISDFRHIRSIVHKNLNSEEKKSFNPFFTELLIGKLSHKVSNPLTVDISYVLSLFLQRVMIASLFTILFLLAYFYVLYGGISDLLVINPEKLNDTKLISSILFDL